jgi:hypothetical protein
MLPDALAPEITGDTFTFMLAPAAPRGKPPTRTTKLVHSFFATDSTIAPFASTAERLTPVKLAPGLVAVWLAQPPRNAKPIAIAQTRTAIASKLLIPCVVDMQPKAICHIFRRFRIDLLEFISSYISGKNSEKHAFFPPKLGESK